MPAGLLVLYVRTGYAYQPRARYVSWVPWVPWVPLRARCLLRLGHLPQPFPQRGRRGRRGGIVYRIKQLFASTAAYVSVPVLSRVCGGGQRRLTPGSHTWLTPNSRCVCRAGRPLFQHTVSTFIAHLSVFLRICVLCAPRAYISVCTLTGDQRGDSPATVSEKERK